MIIHDDVVVNETLVDNLATVGFQERNLDAALRRMFDILTMGSDPNSQAITMSKSNLLSAMKAAARFAYLDISRSNMSL